MSYMLCKESVYGVCADDRDDKLEEWIGMRQKMSELKMSERVARKVVT